MTLGGPGETYEIPQDPEERKRHLKRAGEIITREGNELRTFSPELDKARREAAGIEHTELKPLPNPPSMTREGHELRTFSPEADRLRRERLAERSQQLTDEAESASDTV